MQLPTFASPPEPLPLAVVPAAPPVEQEKARNATVRGRLRGVGSDARCPRPLQQTVRRLPAWFPEARRSSQRGVAETRSPSGLAR